MKVIRNLLRRLSLQIVVLTTFLTPHIGLLSQQNIIPFPEVWEKYSKTSPAARAAAEELQASKTASGRSGRHWLPRIYAGGQVFNTNDPAYNFMGILGQRDARQMDFATKFHSSELASGIIKDSNYLNTNSFLVDMMRPNTLNYPGSHTYQAGKIGIDIPLYEGGMKSNIAAAESEVEIAKKHQLNFIVLNEYGHTAVQYATLNSLLKQKKQLENLLGHVNAVLAGYQVGVAGNPVGYSGLLGLRSLRNRITGMIAENQAKQERARRSIQEVSGISENWLPEDMDALDFGDKYLKSGTSGNASSYTLALQSYAKSMEHAADAEYARFLPRTGVFGEALGYGGERGTASSYYAGFYIQMNLFNATDFGAVEQARHNQAAMQAKAEEQKVKEKVLISSMLEAELALKKNLALMKDSSRMLEEQTITSRRLFLNGLINALQLTEVFSRRADLAEHQTKAELEYLTVKAGLVTLTGTNEGVHHVE